MRHPSELYTYPRCPQRKKREFIISKAAEADILSLSEKGGIRV